ncbi:hypothetical protein HanXRQr2_Chr01g0035171 [Helianthus annuus]|uniref:Uncharacterized protein n=1 Tax=Helianthus annuus TaxID=4232 RepID=A0A9K3P3Y2_HELAN|nr:hypothetical protein HanXRQr2_Chr01g0035171 [Helianthus annuus]
MLKGPTCWINVNDLSVGPRTQANNNIYFTGIKCSNQHRRIPQSTSCKLYKVFTIKYV